MREDCLRMTRGLKRGSVQRAGIEPRRSLPILSRWRRILRTSGGSVMSAMSFISEPHRGQAMASSSHTLASSRARAFLLERVLRC